MTHEIADESISFGVKYQGRVPDSYKEASFRAVLPVGDDGMMGLALNTSGSVVRFKISVDDAKHIAESITDYTRNHKAEQGK
jgi:hypothetical protein